MILTPIALFSLVAVFAGLYATWNIGANDVSNAMGTSVGSKSVTLRQAIIIAAVCEFSGAWLFGKNVSETLRNGIIDAYTIQEIAGPSSIAFGMLASLLATGMWLHFASYFGFPVSTTHSIVGAILGFGLIAGGVDTIHWNTVLHIASSWIVSPLAGAFGAYILFATVRKTILSKPVPIKEAEKILPLLFALFITIASSIWIFSTHTSTLACWLLLTTLCMASWFLFRFVQRKFFNTIPEEERKYIEEMECLMTLEAKRASLLSAKTEQDQVELQEIERKIQTLSETIHPAIRMHYEKKQFERLEKLFAKLQVATACLMAFSHGANDVANGIGPLEAILESLALRGESISQTILPHVLFLGGLGIVVGLAMWGWRVIETIGKNITELTPSRGFSAEFGASITILFASKLGLPISTTHTLVGAVIGVGLAGGIASLNIRTLRDIIASWIVTIPGGALLAILWYHFLLFLFGGRLEPFFTAQ